MLPFAQTISGTCWHGLSKFDVCCCNGSSGSYDGGRCDSLEAVFNGHVLDTNTVLVLLLILFIVRTIMNQHGHSRMTNRLKTNVMHAVYKPEVHRITCTIQ